MADHRPTLGSQLRAVQPWRKNRQIYCVCGRPWTPEHAAGAARPWQAGDGPIPDGEQPRNYIQTTDGGVHLLGDQAFTEAEKRANGGRW